MTNTITRPATQQAESAPKPSPKGSSVWRRAIIAGVLVLAAVAAVVAANVGGEGDSSSQELTRGQAADAARLSAQAEATVPTDVGPTMGQIADAARRNAQADVVVTNGGLTAGQIADAARLTAQADAQAAQEQSVMQDLINRGLIPAQALDDPGPGLSGASNWSSLDAVQRGEVSPQALDAEITRLKNLADSGGSAQGRFVNGR